jgi:hypothetical protein
METRGKGWFNPAVTALESKPSNSAGGETTSYCVC